MARPRKDKGQVYGRSGTSVFAGILIDEYEYNATLEGLAGLDIYNQMRRSDAMVNATLESLCLPILNADWQIVGKEDYSPEEEEIIEFCRWAFFHKMNFAAVLAQAVDGVFWAGHSVFEKVYQVDESSGYLFIGEMSPRLQQTIQKWNFDGKDKLISITQSLPFATLGARATDIVIPAENIVIFNRKQEGSDLRGRSILRCCYKHWWFKQNLEKAGAIGAERGAVGFPYANIPESGLQDEARKTVETILENIRLNHQAYAIFPYGVEPKNFSLETKIDSNIMPQIKYHNEEIAKSILAQFLNLGTTETGARALGESFMNMFLKGLSGTANQIRNVFQKQVLNDMVEKNWSLDEDRYPQLEVSGIELEDVIGLGDFIQKIQTYLTPTEQTERYIRKVVGLPDLEKGEYGEAKKEKQESLKPPEEEESEEGGGKVEEGEKPEEEKTPAMIEDVSRGTSLQDKPAPLKTDVDWAFWRELTIYEKCMALREIVGKEDDTTVALVQETDAMRRKVVEDLIEQATAAVAEKSLKAALKIELNKNLVKELAGTMVDNLDEMYEYGRSLIQGEMEKQKKAMKRPEVPMVAFAGLKPGDKKAAFEWLTAISLQKSESALAPVAARVRENVLSAIRNNSGDIDDILEGAEEFSRQRVERSVQELIHESFSQGRASGADELKEQVKYCIYSAIMDTNTCVECQNSDGDKVTIDSAEYFQLMPPNQKCLGGDMCRCVWIYVFEEEGQ